MSDTDPTNEEEDLLAPTKINTNPPFPTKKELLELIAERDKMLDNPELRYDPPWLQDANDENRKALRRVSRKINRQTTRLEQATQKLEQDFDMNS